MIIPMAYEVSVFLGEHGEEGAIHELYCKSWVSYASNLSHSLSHQDRDWEQPWLSVSLSILTTKFPVLEPLSPPFSWRGGRGREVKGLCWGLTSRKKPEWDHLCWILCLLEPNPTSPALLCAQSMTSMGCNQCFLTLHLLLGFVNGHGHGRAQEAGGERPEYLFLQVPLPKTTARWSSFCCYLLWILVPVPAPWPKALQVAPPCSHCLGFCALPCRFP